MADIITAAFAALIVFLLAGLLYRVFLWAFGWLLEEDSPSDWGTESPPGRDRPPAEYVCCACGTRDYRIVAEGKPYCYACAEKAGVLQ